ncbi:MAG: aminopeptidase [Pseudomonadales bacterium]|nr:aminopeptidase [Candidatus Woesebacteria bacterium]MCB9800843.1 aminopeptidase [Pseudomonadales bacterium]
MNGSYTPPQEVLENYANVLVNFALGGGNGIKKGDVVQLAVPDIATPLALELQTAVLKASGHPLVRIIPSNFDKDFFNYASDEQLTFFPENYLKEKAKLLDHTVSVIADINPTELADVDPKRIMLSREAKYPYREWLFAKEHRGEFSWTLGLWGTQAKADIVGLSLEEYWEQIIHACYLDARDPIAEWKRLSNLQKDIQTKLNALEIETIHIEGEDIDLTIKLGANRAWKTGSGCNIPSFEHFTSPDWRGTNGWVAFNQPLYRYGNIIEGIALEFKDGLVTKATATKGEKILKDMISTKNADKLGEFSLTDKRLSRITHPMAETLYDENIGGPYGNTHVAVGMAYKDCFKGKASEMTESDWKEMGYNNSSVHTDIVSTTDRTATATLTDGSKVVIYKDGMFVL